MIRYIFIAMMVLSLAYNFLRYVLIRKQHRKPLPKTVRDIYDKKEYARWLEYQDANQRVDLIESVVSTCAGLVLFSTNALAWMYSRFALGELGQSCLLLCIYFLICELVSLPFEYIKRFKIEEKYGMNRCSVKTFVVDMVREYVIYAVLFCIICGLYVLAYHFFEDQLVLVTSAAMVALIIALNPIGNLFVNAGNKLVPLEDGSLKTKLTELFENEGCHLKEIYVRDDSLRTTKANAYTMGIGKQKKIVLSDNLFGRYTEEEIVAFFAHELGHYKHHDMPKLMVMNVVKMLVWNFAMCAVLLIPQISMAFGFTGACAAFAVITVMGSSVFSPVHIALTAFCSLAGKSGEYRADEMAVDNGYGEALITGFRKLAKENLSDLNPHPVLLAMENEHPPIHKRIEEIHARMKK